jgi:hypothetical protein
MMWYGAGVKKMEKSGITRPLFSISGGSAEGKGGVMATEKLFRTAHLPV